MSNEITAGTVEPLWAYAQKASDGTALTGSSNLRIQIQRTADGYFLDFNDGVFKNSGWTTRQATLTEVSSTNAPGQYKYDTAGIDTTGWNTGVYVVTFLEVSTSLVLGGPNFAFGELNIVTANASSLSTRIPAALVSGRMDVSVGAVQNGAITASGFANNAITSSVLAADCITNSQLAASCITSSQIASAAIGATQAPNLDAAVSTRAAASTLTTVATDASNAATRAADIQSRLPDALDGGYMKSKVEAVAAGAITSTGAPALANLDVAVSTAASGVISSVNANTNSAVASLATSSSIAQLLSILAAASPTAATGSTSTIVRSNASQATSFFNGMVLLIINSAGVAARRILSYSNTNGAFTLDSALPFTPSNGDQMYVLGGVAPLSASQVESAVLDAGLSQHTTAGTVGAKVSATASTGDAMALTSGERNATADAILDRSLSGHSTAGTTGQALSRIDVVLSTRSTLTANDVWSTALPGSYTSGMAGYLVGTYLNATISSRAAPGDAMALSTDAVSAAAVSAAAASKIASATMEEMLAGHSVAGSVGATLLRLDTTVSSRAAPGAAMALTSGERTTLAGAIDAVLSANHGNGGWLTAGGFAEPGDAMILTSEAYTAIANSVWNALLASYTITGSTGAKLAAITSSLSADSIATTVWAKSVSGPVVGTYGWYIQKMFQHDFNRQEISVNGTLTFYGDDGSTPMATVVLRDVAGSSLTIGTGSPARRAATVFG